MARNYFEPALRLGAQRQALQAVVAAMVCASRSNMALGVERALKSCSRRVEGEHARSLLVENSGPSSGDTTNAGVPAFAARAW
jgi:hypothetical protein